MVDLLFSNCFVWQLAKEVRLSLLQKCFGAPRPHDVGPASLPVKGRLTLPLTHELIFSERSSILKLLAHPLGRGRHGRGFPARYIKFPP